jgi:hypothetical protein
LKAFFCKELLVTKNKNHEQSPFQLNRYTGNVKGDDNFKILRSLAKLSMMLVKTQTTL